MRIGIDASSIRQGGGGVTHLYELLKAANPTKDGFEEIIVWAGHETLSKLQEQPWLCKYSHPLLDRSLPSILFWQKTCLDKEFHQKQCDILFIPGGSYGGLKHPSITMSQNLLPFEWKEARRYGFSWWTLKFLLIRMTQLSTFKKADGVIFLTEYAYQAVNRVQNISETKISIIPHGVNDRFFHKPREHLPLSCYNFNSPVKIIYVSPIAPYKHQWKVIEAIWHLRQDGLPLELSLVGSIRNCGKQFYDAIKRYDPSNQWVHYLGEIPFESLHEYYRNADVFVFASSCETFGFTLLEAMASGLPIACSNRGPMPELLGSAGIYFDPENPLEIAKAVRLLMSDPNLRKEKAWEAFKKAKNFTWERCANDTFDFIKSIAAR